jgi:hypothetical protein
MLVSSSLDNTLRLWDTEKGRELAVMSDHTDTITGMTAFDTTVYSCSEDRTVRGWTVLGDRTTGVVYGTSPFRCITATSKGVFAGDDAGNLWNITLLNKPRKYRSCFVSHRTADRELAERLRDDLVKEGVEEVWLDTVQLVGGDAFDEAIQKTIAEFDAMLFLSDVSSTQAYARELNIARQLGKPVIVARTTDDARVPRETIVLDFRNWQNSEATYRIAFHQLLDALAI